MKVCKMVFGILNCILFVWITFQSCTANVINSLQNSNDSSGMAGLLFAFILLGTSIAAIATHNNVNRIPNLIICILYWIAGYIAKRGGSGTYRDLSVWAIWAWICAGQVLMTYALAELKKPKTPAANPPSQYQQYNPQQQPPLPQKPQQYQPPKQPQQPPRSNGKISNIAHKKLDEL